MNAPAGSIPANSTPPGLPGAAQAKLNAMRAAEAAPTPAAPTGNAVPPTAPTMIPNTPPAPPAPPTPPTPPTPSATNEPPATPEGERVSLSREEYNALKAGKEARETERGRAESLQLALDEAQHRLTELEKGSKATSQPPASPATPPAPAVTFTAEEEEEFAESRPFIEKVATLVASQLVYSELASLRQRLDTIEQTAQGVASSVEQNNQRSFFSQVQTRVPNMEQLIKHQHWGDFVAAVDPMSGATYSALLAHNVKNGRLDQVVNIYKKFEKEYVAPLSGATNDGQAAYAGANPTGGANPASTNPPAAPQKLKFSDRKKASLDYRHGRITADELAVVVAAFDAADKLDNVDYSA